MSDAIDNGAKSAGSTLTRREAVATLAAAGLGGMVLNDTVTWAQGAPRPTPKPSTWSGNSTGPEFKTKGFKNLSGVKVYYEEQGQGIPLVLTSAGMEPLDTMRRMGTELSKKYRVILWDRSNTGASDFVFKGARDADVWSDQLAELLTALKAGPAYLASCSGGVRTSFMFALRYPDLTKGVVLWDITNTGPGLPQNYFGQYADLAEKEGMAAVAKTPYWSGLLKLNASNEKRLMEVDPKEFIRVMRRWTHGYLSTDVALQISEADARKLNASGVHVRLVGGCDRGHSRPTSDALSKLMPNAEYVNPPNFCEAEVKNFSDAAAWAKEHGERVSMPHWETPGIPEVVDDFISKTEAQHS